MGTDIASLAIKIESLEVQVAQQRLDALKQAGGGAEQAIGGLGASCSGLVSKLAAIGASVGGVYAIQRAFQDGIRTVDAYRVSVIGIAATLTDLAKSGQGSMEEVFNRNKAAAEGMYRSINLEAAKHFASAAEMMTVYNRLVQSGYAVRQNEVAALGTLTDKIKLATQGQNVEIQLNQEIRALMDGQAKTTSLLAMELQSRLGPGWATLVNQHRQAGDLLTWLASLYPGLVSANKEVENTIMAQYATTKSLIDLISIGGLAGAHQNIVDLLKEGNEWLRNNEAIISGGLIRAWGEVKGLVEGVAGFVKEIYKLVSVPISWTINVVGAGANLLSAGAGAGGDFGFGALTGGPAPSRKLTQPWQTTQLIRGTGTSNFMMGANGEMIPIYGTAGEVLPPPTIKNLPGKPEKGGAGGKDTTESAEASVRKFIETMKQETAKGAGDTEAILTAWKNKQLQTLEELANKGADITKGKEALNEAVASKQKKLDSDFTDWYIAGMGNQYEALVKTENKKLAEVSGNEIKTAQVHEVFTRKKSDLDEQVQANTNNLFKGYLDAMASLAPTLEGQLALKRQSLDLELKLSAAALERQIREKQINPEMADQARALDAMTAQAKKFNLEMEGNKGLSGWAYGRVKQDSQKNTISDLMGGLENGLQSSFSSAWQGFLTKDKKNLAKAGQDIVQGMMGELTKGSIHRVFSGMAGMLSPSSGGGDAGNKLNQAATGLNKASVGFNENTAQFALSAGGLLLSGIGIATNSQFLVIAGTVLQVAGLAIQIYQALAATTEITAAGALTAAAGSLEAAALSLMWAAAMDSVPFFHSGGIITAHRGWPRLKSDEVPIIAQTGERVLSRRQNREYEAGMAGGSQQNVNVNVNQQVLQRLDRREIRRTSRVVVHETEREMRRLGRL